MVEKQPLISILMTAFNRESLIGEAIESVLASTYTNFELIIVDDCSTDNTVLIAQSYSFNDDRIKIFVNEKNLGDYPNRNKAASYAQGEYLMYVDSDDTIFTDTISYCLQSMLRFDSAGFGIYWAYDQRDPFLRNSEEAIQKNFGNEPFLGMGPGGTILKRSFFNEIGGYPTKYGPANDMYFNLKAVCCSAVVLLPRKFMNYRIHENQERNNQKGYILNNYLYFEDALRELPFKLDAALLKRMKSANKRRFLINIFQFLFIKGEFKILLKIIRKARFGFTDTLDAFSIYTK
jgi:glycosyltransferase involved in cell wall biosynthesis